MTPFPDYKPDYHKQPQQDSWGSIFAGLVATALLIFGIGGAFIIGDEKSCRAEQAQAAEVRESMGVQR